MIDATVLLREYLLGQATVTALLGTNANNSIYCAYDLPEHFDPTLGPAIQIFRAGGHSHSEITVLVDARVQIRAWADVELYSTASDLYGAIHDVLHGLCGYTVVDGTIVRAQEASGPFEMTDPETGWVAMYAFYMVMARPTAGSSLGPSGGGTGTLVGVWYEGFGAPVTLEGNGNYYLDLATGDVYLQVSGLWGSPIGNIRGSGGGGGVEVPSLTYHKVSGAGTNAAVVKSSSGLVAGWKIYNNTNYPIYVKLYNKATTPIPGTDTPQQTIGVEAGLGEVNPAGPGTSFSAGIAIAITKSIADDDTTPIAANDCVVDIFYQ
jgi:hypothetical protein